jgi:lysophospholipase L1-like esterase
VSRRAVACAAAVLSLALSACGAGGGASTQAGGGGRGTTTAAGGGGPIVPAARALTVPGLGTATRIEAFGHSYVGAAGVGVERGFYTLVARHFAIPATGQAAGGGTPTVIAQLADVYHQAALQGGGPQVQLALVMWGINDLADYGRAGLPAVRNGLISLISRIRAAPGDIHGFADPSVRLTGSWQPGQAVTTTTGDASIDIALPAGARGRTIGFVAPASQGNGALYRFAVDGRDAGDLDTRKLSPAVPANPDGATPMIERLQIGQRARALRVQVSGVVGHAGFLGWHVEAAPAPLIAVLHQPRLPGYGAYPHPERIGDDGVAALNHTIDAAVAAFTDGRVVVADAEDPLGGDGTFFQGDRLHPTAVGHEWLARRTIEALEAAAARLSGQAGG